VNEIYLRRSASPPTTRSRGRLYGRIRRRPTEKSRRRRPQEGQGAMAQAAGVNVTQVEVITPTRTGPQGLELPWPRWSARSAIQAYNQEQDMGATTPLAHISSTTVLRGHHRWSRRIRNATSWWFCLAQQGQTAWSTTCRRWNATSTVPKRARSGQREAMYHKIVDTRRGRNAPIIITATRTISRSTTPAGGISNRRRRNNRELDTVSWVLTLARITVLAMWSNSASPGSRCRWSARRNR